MENMTAILKSLGETLRLTDAGKNIVSIVPVTVPKVNTAYAGVAARVTYKNGHMKDIDISDILFISGVQRSFNDIYGELITKRSVCRISSQLFAYRTLQIFICVIRTQFKSSYQYHTKAPASFLAASPASVPATKPLEKAHCRLYPPQGPSISAISPQT